MNNCKLHKYMIEDATIACYLRPSIVCSPRPQYSVLCNHFDIVHVGTTPWLFVL
jgi:hypothetical protein